MSRTATVAGLEADLDHWITGERAGGSRLSGVGRKGGTWSFDFCCDLKNTCTNPDRWTM